MKTLNVTLNFRVFLSA